MQIFFSRKWIIRHLLVLVVVVVLVNLGFWQLRRLAEKRAYNAGIVAALAQPPVTLTGDETDAAALHFRRVRVTGEFDNAQSMVLRNRSLDGRPGVHLLVPLRIKGSEAAVLVNRGWLPREQASPESRAVYALTGETTVEGIAYRSQTRPDGLAPVDRLPDGADRLDAWFRVDIDQIQGQVPYPLLPVYVVQSGEAADSAASLPRPVGQVELDEGPHLSYAVQWFLFAGVLVVIYAVFIHQEWRREISRPDGDSPNIPDG